MPSAPGISANTVTRVRSLRELPVAYLGASVVDNEFRGSFLIRLKYLLQLIVNQKLINKKDFHFQFPYKIVVVDLKSLT